MESAKSFMKNLVDQAETHHQVFKRNLLKEYLQILVLDFIYSHPKHSQLVFYGGSCLSQCYGLPRLSEDLDFVDINNKISLSALSKDLIDYFKKESDLRPASKVQKFRIYLKFPILHELGLVTRQESNQLLLKIEIFKDFDFCSKYKIENKPLFKFNKSILVRTFDLPTLMSTKIRAILFRKWEKTRSDGRTIIKVKGRDYFDLMWYLQKNIKPNYRCLENFNNNSLLKNKLMAIVDRVDPWSIQLDLESLIDQPDFVRNISQKMKEILASEISSKL